MLNDGWAVDMGEGMIIDVSEGFDWQQTLEQRPESV